MMENEPILCGSNANILSSALPEVKAIGYKKAGAQLDDAKRSMRSLCISLMPKDRQEKEKFHSCFSPFVSAWC